MTKEKKKEDKENEGLDIDFGIGKLSLGLGGLLNGIGNLVDMAAKLKEAGGEIGKEGEIDLSSLKEGMKSFIDWFLKIKTGK